MFTTFQDAFRLLVHLDAGVIGIVPVSLQVSLSALLATEEFRGKRSITVTLNTLIGVPTVIVGVVVYLLLSRTGPLGAWGWLFTPKGMILSPNTADNPSNCRPKPPNPRGFLEDSSGFI